MPGYNTTQQIDQGSYVTTTQVWDLGQLQDIDITSPQFKELLIRLYQQINNICLVVNTKITGYYITDEFLTSSLYFNPATTDPMQLRSEYRRTFDIGPLGPGVTTVAHNLAITNAWQFTHIYGTATDNIGFNYYPIPFASAGGAANIELRLDATNIIITNNSGIAFTSCIVVAEYLKF